MHPHYAFRSVFLVFLFCGCVKESGTRQVGHRVFITSEIYDGARSGGNGADATCATLAANAGLTGDWKAILSTGEQSAIDRLAIVGPILNTQDQLVAENHDDLWDGTLSNSIRYDEKGADVDSEVWTGTDSNGHGSAQGTNCRGWEDVYLTGYLGKSSSKDGEWTKSSSQSCNTQHHLYCLSGAVPVPAQNLIGFSAKAGTENPGEVFLTFTIPGDVSTYSKVEIRRRSGTSAPKATCDDAEDTLVKKIEFPVAVTENSISVTDATEVENGMFSYRLCGFSKTGAVLSSPPALAIKSKGRTGHEIFVTSTTFNGNLGGLSGADTICQAVAKGAGLTGTWKAVLSTATTNAKTRIAISGTVLNRKGELIATDANDLWKGTISHAVNYDQTGAAVSSEGVWTGTSNKGESFGTNSDCSAWTYATGTTYWGSIGSATGTGTWLYKDHAHICGPRSLYCISQ